MINSKLVTINNDVSKSDILYTPRTMADMLKLLMKQPILKDSFGICR